MVYSIEVNKTDNNILLHNIVTTTTIIIINKHISFMYNLIYTT